MAHGRAEHRQARAAARHQRHAASSTFGGHRFRSHGDERPRHGGHVPRRSSQSCNVYYYSLANEHGRGPDRTTQLHAVRLRAARPASTCEGEVTGVPAFHRMEAPRLQAPEQQKWYAGETISLGIGQGYNNFTSAADGHRHGHAGVAAASATSRALVREVEDVVTARAPAAWPAKHCEPLAAESRSTWRSSSNALHGVTTGRHLSACAFAGAPYADDGATGTAQAVGL